MPKPSTPPRGFFPAGAGRVVPLKSPTRSIIPASPNQRMKELLSRPDAKALVRHTPPQDLFLLVKQVGIGDSHELLSLASLDQVQRMVDMDVWTRDEIRLDDYGEWLRAMVEVHHENLGPLIQELDPELLLLFLQDHIKVYLREDDSPEPEVLELESKNLVATSDQVFLLEFMPEDDWQDFILALIDRVYGLSMKTAHWLLFAVMSELSSNLEEQALRLKNGRMDEAGFPDTFEAMAIYQPLNTLTPLARVLPERPSSGPLREVPLPLERFRPADGSLLTRALEVLARRTPEDEFSHDLLRLSNKVLAAQARNPGELDDIREALEQTHAYVNLGLELVVGGALEAPLMALQTPEAAESAATALSSIHVEWLFRRGFTAALELQKQARPVLVRLNRSWQRPLEVQADMPWRHWLDGIRRLRPERWQGTRPTPTGPVLSFGPFSTREQLAEARVWIQEVDILRRFVFELLAPEPTEVRLIRRSLAEMNIELAPQNILWTATARRLLGGAFSPEPLNPTELNAFVEKAFVEKAFVEKAFVEKAFVEKDFDSPDALGQPRALRPEVQAALTSWVDVWKAQPRAESETDGRALAAELALLQRYLDQGEALLRERYGLSGQDGATERQMLAGPILVNLR